MNSQKFTHIKITLRFLSFILLFSIASDLLANDPPVASIEFSSTVEENNISLFVNSNHGAEAYTEFINKGGEHCLFIPMDKYAYFRVNDAAITPNDNNLIVEITYFDEGLGNLSFQYNTIDGDYDRQSFNKTNSNAWVSVKFGIKNASFRNAQNNQADFRINENNYIKRVSIAKDKFQPGEEEVPATEGSSYSEFKGKSVAGYQAWFTASETNSGWVHWPKGRGNRPEKGNASFEIYPDVRDYNPENLYNTGFANLGNGKPSRLFSSIDVIDTHFEWMKDAGIDGIALQRFIGDNPYPISYSPLSKLKRVKDAAEKNKKIFYICYDISRGDVEDAWVESIKFDWVFNIEQTNELTSSHAYATVNGKPVVQIWGTGFHTRPSSAAGAVEIIEFLKSRGCYVIGGVPTGWRAEERDSRPGFIEAYKTYDMISPWTPGRYRDISGIDHHKRNYLVPDKEFCDANQLDYMPVVFPGFGWSTWKDGKPNHTPRLAGDFVWRQAYNAVNTGIDQVYFAMFDEYDEGTSYMKAATDWSMIPTDQYFLTYSADGIWVSSDFYLRLAGAVTEMAKNPSSLSPAFSTPYSLGPVYYRNSFEKRYTEYVEKNSTTIRSGIYNLDPCFYKEELLNNNSVGTAVCEIVENVSNAKNGQYTVKVSGNPNSSSNATFDYKIADVKIPVVRDMKLSFWKKTIDELGRFVSLDLQFASGRRLSQLDYYTDQNGKNMHPKTGRGTVGRGYEQFVCNIGKGELVNDSITAIIVSYDKAETSASYTAYLVSARKPPFFRRKPKNILLNNIKN
ncbi:MAG: hypothetical protein K9G70_11165 [Prolixibacteraceae bacterium]|nr:hypothetical protein [Prolixibacteraceae bacterium]